LSGPPSEDAAIVAGQYFLDLFHYAFLTGDDSGIRSFSEPDCSYCNSVVAHVAGERAAAEHESGGEISVTTSRGTRVDAEFYTANFTIEQKDSEVLDSQGRRTDGSPGGTFTVDVALNYRNGAWSVAAVQAKKV
jgi:hypothetical protein